MSGEPFEPAPMIDGPLPPESAQIEPDAAERIIEPLLTLFELCHVNADGSEMMRPWRIKDAAKRIGRARAALRHLRDQLAAVHRDLDTARGHLTTYGLARDKAERELSKARLDIRDCSNELATARKRIERCNAEKGVFIRERDAAQRERDAMRKLADDARGIARTHDQAHRARHEGTPCVCALCESVRAYEEPRP